jgi:hypothetical protein
VQAASRLWIALLIELGLCLSLPGILWHGGLISPALAFLLPPSLMLAVRCALVAGSFAFAGFVQPGRTHLSFQTYAAMVAKEIAAFVRFQYLIMSEPLRKYHGESCVATYSKDAPVVVLLHGVYCSRAVWRPLIRELHARTGLQVEAPSLAPVESDLTAQSRSLARWLDRRHAGRPIILVAHSMSGLAARLCLAVSPAASTIRQLICLGTPHNGTLIANILSTPIGRDLRPRSKRLAELSRIESNGTVVSLYTEHDNLVVPFESARLPHARNIALRGVGHMSLIYSREVLELVTQEIGKSVGMHVSIAAREP